MGKTDLTVVVLVDIPSEIVQSLQNSDGIKVVQLEPDAADLTLECERLSPCVLLTPEHFIQSTGLSFITELERAKSPVHILVVCNPKPGVVADLLHLGCSGALNLDTPPEEISRAVKAVAGGELWFPRKVLSVAVRTLLSTVTEKRLTQREKEVLTLIGQGFSNREIADKMFITRETVRWHVRGLYSKIGTRARKRVTARSPSPEERFAS